MPGRLSYANPPHPQLNTGRNLVETLENVLVTSGCTDYTKNHENLLAQKMAKHLAAFTLTMVEVFRGNFLESIWGGFGAKICLGCMFTDVGHDLSFWGNRTSHLSIRCLPPPPQCLQDLDRNSDRKQLVKFCVVIQQHKTFILNPIKNSFPRVFVYLDGGF